MGWNTITTWLAGQKPSASDFNGISLDIRTWGGNVNANSNRLDGLAGFTAATQPHILSSATSGQSIPNNAWTQVALQLDSGASGISRASGVFTIPITGLYLLSGVVSFAVNATGLRYTQWWNVGTGLPLGLATSAPGSSLDATWLAAPTVALSIAAGTQIALYCYQSSGAALSLRVDAGSLYTYVSLAQLS